MNKYLILVSVVLLLSACNKQRVLCNEERIERYKSAIARHEECLTFDNCIFDQNDIYYYDRNKAKLAECEAHRSKK